MGASNDYCDKYGNTALHKACLKGWYQLVQLILHEYPEEINAKMHSFFGFRTPLGKVNQILAKTQSLNNKRIFS